MKVRFHEHDQAKPLVRSEQESTKQTRFRRKPYWMLFIIFFLLVGVVYAGYQMVEGWSIRTRGIVVAKEVAHSSHDQSVVSVSYTHLTLPTNREAEREVVAAT